MAIRKSDRFLRNITILLGMAALAVGCGPSSLAMLLAPFVDDRVAPKCKLANPDKEITVVIASRFENLEIRSEVQPADQELAERFASELTKRFKENKEKVTVVPPARVKSHLSKLKTWDAASLKDVGERHFKADYVIYLNIQNMSLVMPNTYSQLYKGNSDVEVIVYDLHLPTLESTIHRESFRCIYPSTHDVDASTCSPQGFRNQFLGRMSRDLARWFTAYPSDQKFDID